MEESNRFRRLWSRITGCVRRRGDAPAMIGMPPSQRPAIPDDPAEHATDFAHRYAELMNFHVENRMVELGIHPDRIGMPDTDHGIVWAAFHPHDKIGGNNAPTGNLIVDSGLFNLDLLREDYGEEAAQLFERSRLRDRLDAIIAHEYEESRHGMSHVAALEHAPKTDLPISERGREIAEAMRKGWKR